MLYYFLDNIVKFFFFLSKHIPARVRVLYTGQSYTPDVGDCLLATGINQMHGISVNSSLGLDSHISILFLSNAQPSMYKPRM